jgi:hypothetical protein
VQAEDFFFFERESLYIAKHHGTTKLIQTLPRRSEIKLEPRTTLKRKITRTDVDDEEHNRSLLRVRREHGCYKLATASFKRLQQSCQP